MDEKTFNDHMNAARAVGGDYAAGYITGLRAHYHGAQFTLPAPAEVLGDVARFGERATGFNDGYAGRAPLRGESRGEIGVIQFSLPMAQKSRYVRSARAAGMKLVPWILWNLDRASEGGSEGE